MMLPPHLVKSKMQAWLYSLLTPVETTKNIFLTETQINGQTIVLETFLNTAFNLTSPDPIIYIQSKSDILPRNFIYSNLESQPPIFIYQKSENKPSVWLYKNIQYTYNSGFIVKVPNSIADKTPDILQLVNKYKLAGKAVIIETY